MVILPNLLFKEYDHMDMNKLEQPYWANATFRVL